ncbi:hypothetical protein [Pectobacterium brasiliense]|uniref:hypothetical protein n=1 Tax=Pectobacterium brasiliense TaxID=180957 RepID=UPI002A7F5022|nr:hypothetical protein [Pectobacterium brasiliense]MDY4380921.1 hypothetical protein [Pectobacterium brasiliense]
MSFYSWDKRREKINETNSYIISDVRLKYEKNKDRPLLSFRDNSDGLFEYVILPVWSYFYSILSKKTNELDENTKFNQQYISTHMDFSIEDYKSDKVGFLSNLLRVLYEYKFWTGIVDGDRLFSKDTLTILDDVFGHNEHSYNYQFGWIRDSLPIVLAQWMLKSKNFLAAIELVSNIDNARTHALSDIDVRFGIIQNTLENDVKGKARELSDIYLDTLQKFKKSEDTILKSTKNIDVIRDELSGLEDKIKNLRTEYNFVGLSSGFERIKEKKEKELRNSEVYYKNLFGCMFIAPVFAFLSHFIKPGFYPENFSAVFILFPLVTIELVLIYFFRLSYLESKSIRTQLVQIELRLSLCAFVQNYVEYRKEHGKNISKLLDSFDNLIFSPIQVNDSNIPSMFDGADAIADLAGKIMKNK